jgi:hypothetical protein
MKIIASVPLAEAFESMLMHAMCKNECHKNFIIDLAEKKRFTGYKQTPAALFLGAVWRNEYKVLRRWRLWVYAYDNAVGLHQKRVLSTVCVGI